MLPVDPPSWRMKTLNAYIRQERMFKQTPILPYRERRLAYLMAWGRQQQAIEEFGRYRVVNWINAHS